jgi:GMP synthase-like glutamine amidotransferase
MSLLIVDNGTTLLPALTRLLPTQIQIKKWSDLSTCDPDAYEGIILSGGSIFEIEGHESQLANEMRIVREYAGPLLGICYGMEVMVRAHGGALEKMPQDHYGVIDVRVLEPDDIFGSCETFSIYEHHQWRVVELPNEFKPLAISMHGYEAIRHRARPHYGLQFHPEKIVEGISSLPVIEHFLSLI